MLRTFGTLRYTFILVYLFSLSVLHSTDFSQLSLLNIWNTSLILILNVIINSEHAFKCWGKTFFRINFQIFVTSENFNRINRNEVNFTICFICCVVMFGLFKSVRYFCKKFMLVCISQ